MRIYNVHVPFTGYVVVTLTTDEPIQSAKDAFNKALNVIESDDFTLGKDSDNCSLAEMEYHQCVVQGNVWHGVLSEVEWDQVEDGADERPPAILAPETFWLDTSVPDNEDYRTFYVASDGSLWDISGGDPERTDAVLTDCMQLTDDSVDWPIESADRQAGAKIEAKIAAQDIGDEGAEVVDPDVEEQPAVQLVAADKDKKANKAKKTARKAGAGRPPKFSDQFILDTFCAAYQQASDLGRDVGLTAAQIPVDMNPRRLAQRLDRLVADGELRKVGRGRYGLPVASESEGEEGKHAVAAVCG